MSESKLEIIKILVLAGRGIEALKIAAKFPRLGEQRDRISRAWSAYTHPETYRGMGLDPDGLVADGIAATRERFKF